jgi:hypothetical protein
MYDNADIEVVRLSVNREPGRAPLTVACHIAGERSTMSEADNSQSPAKAKETDRQASITTETNRRRRRPTREISAATLEEVRGQIDSCLEIVKRKLYRYSWSDIGLTYATIVCSTLATSIAGYMGLGGERAAAATPGGWRAMCILAAFLSFVVTLATTLAGKFHVAETVARCKACQQDFDNLKIDFMDREPASVVAQFKKLRKAYNDILAGAN